MATKTARQKIEDILQISSGWVGNKLTVGNAEVELTKYRSGSTGKATWQWGLFIHTTRTTHLDGGWNKTRKGARRAGENAMRLLKLT